VDDATIRAVGQELLAEHEEVMSLTGDPFRRAMHEVLHTELVRALRQLPDDAMWAITQPDPGVYLLTGSELRLVRLDPERTTATVTSVQIVGGRLVASEEYPPHTDDWRNDVVMRHVWVFGYASDAPGDDALDMLHRIEGAVQHDIATGQEWPDRREEVARSIAAQLSDPSIGQAVMRIEQDLVHAGRWYRRFDGDDGRLQTLVNDAIAHHHARADQISVLTGVPVTGIEALNQAPDI
jgi:hypothetical protein